MKPAFLVIDIGSNSVRRMLGAWQDGRAVSLSKALRTTRLAAGLDASRCLCEERVTDTIDAIRAYAEEAEALGIPTLAYATSAVRDAANKAEFAERVKAAAGIDVLVLSGEEEGAYAYEAATGGIGTVFDIGGGSFQIVTDKQALSVPCGCVRAKDRCDAQDVPTLERELFAWIDATATLPERVPSPVYGVGGTITSLGALLAGQTVYDGNALSAITPDRLDALLHSLCAQSEQERTRHPLLRERGQVILQGATILRCMMLRTHTDRVVPTDRDGMEGIAEARLRPSASLN